MSQRQIVITLKSPVCIAQNHGVTNVVETLDFIPGSTIRGALALHYLEKHGHWDDNKRGYEITDSDKNAEFDRIFNSDSVRFGNCYPEGSQPIPFTATSCKYSPGFGTKYHGVLDLLLPSIKYDSIEKPAGKQFDEAYEYCHCGAVMDRFFGFYQKTDSGFLKVNPAKRLISHTAVLDSLESALPGSFYTIEVLDEKKEFESNNFKNQVFEGHLTGEDALIDLLLENISSNRFCIGLGKSRGHGEIELKILENEADTGLQKRLDKLKIRMSRLDIAPDRSFFSVTLHSDLILLDELLRFKSILELSDLIEATPGISPDQINILNRFKLQRCWTKTHLVSGWNNAWKLPKPDELAISRGSVFLFATDTGQQLNPKEEAELVALFSGLEVQGLGERRSEGFGEIRFCDEFHWEVSKK